MHTVVSNLSERIIRILIQLASKGLVGCVSSSKQHHAYTSLHTLTACKPSVTIFLILSIIIIIIFLLLLQKHLVHTIKSARVPGRVTATTKNGTR